MKKIVILGSLALFSLGTMAQTAAKKAVEPAVASIPANEVLVVNEDVHNFGKIPQGKPVHTNFEVKNTGTTPLKISNVQASCGCTTPEWDKENAIAPGATSTIKVGYNAQSEGPFTKAITITYNEATTKVITIKGEVWKTPASSAPENKGINELKN